MKHIKNLFIKSIFLFIFFHVSGFAQEENCIPKNDIRDLSQHFRQFTKYANQNNEQFCKTDMNNKWFQIAQSLVLLKNIKPNEPYTEFADALTYKAIEENDWWRYFTKRAKKFRIHNNCQQGVVAFVQTFWGGGTINLCPLFFEYPTSSQTSTLLHEVRHFDGHGHVRCTRGLEKGNRGGCDNKITDKGSYAISVQANVGLARSPELNRWERSILKSEAVYMAFNKFNKLPEIKLNKSIVLSNDQGEVYEWNEGASVNFLKQLPGPSKVIRSGNAYTIFPLDTSVDAYRMDLNFLEYILESGLFANKYNSLSESERNDIKTISYQGTGGLLKNNTLISHCNYETPGFYETPLDQYGEIEALVTLSNLYDITLQNSHLLSSTGDLIPFQCTSYTASDVNFRTQDKVELETSLPKFSTIFGLGLKNYGLSIDGALYELNHTNGYLTGSLVNFPVRNENWVSATSFIYPQVLSE